MSGGYNYNWIQWKTVDRFQVELDVKVKLILYPPVFGQIFHLIVVITDKCVSSQLNWFPFPQFSLSLGSICSTKKWQQFSCEARIGSIIIQSSITNYINQILYIQLKILLLDFILKTSNLSFKKIPFYF